MNKTEQGVLHQSKLARWLIHILLSLTFFLSHPVFSETATDGSPALEINTPRHHVLIVYSPDSTLHTNVIENLSDNLKLKYSDIDITKITPEEITPEKITDAQGDYHDLVIAIGRTGIQSAAVNYPKTKKLFISTDPNKYQLDPVKNKNDAILYMTQPYCRQIRFIKLINPHWKTISVLNSQEKPIDSTTIQQCANNYDFKLYAVSIATDENLTNKIKHALHHSDVLLALPDSNIYNSKTVKNILLTSYRYRKPIIAFSKNFVNAGALASINSDTEQIAQSASHIVEQFFDSGERFINPVNHPETFNINLNRQVFRALDQIVPDTNKLKQSMQDDSGKSS
ncbi:MAG: hypothetical protein GQ550_01815 [Gammaproteobacteria bacterium]|nr:hypothetical protein [Gammaproteobacteria bacterium]